MLDPKKDRLDYGELLRPPAGFEFDRAVATTYSADLGTVLSLPVALVYAQTLEGETGGSRLQMLEGIKKFASRVTIYHQKGQLHVPAKLSWLFAYLEDALVPVLMDSAFKAFHPKLWVIRYRQDEQGATGEPEPARYRVIVLSRNLTFDRSWDVAAHLEGSPASTPIATNRPLVEFMRWLNRKGELDDIAAFTEELSRVDFETPSPFKGHAFHPVGIPGHERNPISDHEATNSLVISPFLHESTIRRLRANTSNNFSLFSEQYELAKLPPDALEGVNSYQLSRLIVDGESHEQAEEGGTDTQQQHLHAKVFILGRPQRCTWFLGSANATEAAMGANVEFLLEAYGTARPIRPRRQLELLAGDEDTPGPFDPFHPAEGGQDEDGEAAAQAAFRRFEYALLNADMGGEATLRAGGKNYDLRVRIDLTKVKSQRDLRIHVQPLAERQQPRRLEPGESFDHTFENIAEVELSRFLQFRIETGGGDPLHKFLLRIDIDGLPDDRLDNILRRIIDSRDKFFDYLRFLLADEVTKEDLLDNTEPAEGGQQWDDGEDGWHGQLPIYEQLLVAASRSPKKLAAVDEVIRKLESDDAAEQCVIPEAFLSFWGYFRESIHRGEGGD